ncbi:MAG TPA: helix-hairpin-helix domain-containing protein, partial [Chitinophagaceae bacterium]
MKSFLLILFVWGYPSLLFSQEAPLSVRQQQAMEELAEKDETGIEDDSFLQQLEHFRRHPVNINKAGAEELFRLQLLSAIQINSLLQYRKMLGDLVHIYELQAVPHWDIDIIQKVLPFIAVSEKTLNRSDIGELKDGTATLLFRYSQSLKEDGSKSKTSENYLGSPQKLLIRYRYNYKDRVQAGVLADKDAGEPLFRHKQQSGFDFYSYHLFIR